MLLVQYRDCLRGVPLAPLTSVLCSMPLYGAGHQLGNPRCVCAYVYWLGWPVNSSYSAHPGASKSQVSKHMHFAKTSAVVAIGNWTRTWHEPVQRAVLNS
jgi:hypothetical protein